MSEDEKRPPEAPDAGTGDGFGRPTGSGLPAPPRPQPPELPPTDQDHVRELRSARNLALASSIMGPLSLFIGGTLLSIAGLVCGILGLRKIKAIVASDHTSIGMAAQSARRACLIATVFSGIAAVLNAIAVAIMFPIVLEAMQSGDFSAIYPNQSQNPSSTWG